jgi:hypothetical protein
MITDMRILWDAAARLVRAASGRRESRNDLEPVTDNSRVEYGS